MDIKQLKRFLDICETKSFTKTAENLYISQQALSSSIYALEEELNRPLFSRTAKGVIPTEAGLFLKELCTPLVKSFDDMLIELTLRFDNTKEKLFLGLVPEVLRASSPNLLLRYRETYPNIELKAIESLDTICINHVMNGTVELAFCPRPHDDSLVEYIHLRAESVYAVIHKNSPLAKNKTLSMKDLINEKIVTLNEYHQIYHKILACFRTYGFTPRFMVESGESSILLSMVKTNMCAFICMEHIALTMDEFSCVRIPIADPDMIWEYGIVYKKDRKLGRSAKQLIDFLSKGLQSA